MKNLLSLLLLAVSASALFALSPEARRSFEAFEQKAENGDPEAQFRLSALLERGFDSIPPDTLRSLSLLRRSANGGFAPAQNYLGFLFGQGLSAGGKVLLVENQDSLRYWISRAADGGDAKAAHNFAWMLLGEGRDSLAVDYLRKGADARLPQSLTLLADLYAEGRALPVDTLVARNLYEDAISLGWSDAQLRLLNMMGPRWTRLAPEEALREGIRYYGMGAHTIAVSLLEQIGPDTPQTPRAYALLGDAASRGWGMPYNHNLALSYFARAAILGNPSAAFILAETLEIFPDALAALGNPSFLLPEIEPLLTPEALRRQAAAADIRSAEEAASRLLSSIGS